MSMLSILNLLCAGHLTAVRLGVSVQGLLGALGQAIALADDLGIPVYNLFNKDFDAKFKHHMDIRKIFW